MRVLELLGRLLGVALLSRLAARLPGRTAWWASLVVLIVVNLLPVWAVLRGAAGIGDVFCVYWIENVVVWLTSIVRVATAQGTGDPPVKLTVSGSSRPPRELGAFGSAAFFAVHYGLFTLVHGVFTAVIVFLTGGLTGGWVPVAVLSGAIAAAHLVSLGLIWFGRGERKVVSRASAMAAPYPRMLVLHVAIIGSFFLLLGGPGGGGPLGVDTGVDTGVALLCGLKTVIDVGFHLRRMRRVPVVEEGDGLYGPATV